MVPGALRSAGVLGSRTGTRRGGGGSGAATARSVPGAVRTRECAEPAPCPRGPAEDEEDAGGAGVLALLAAPLAPGPQAPRVEAAFHCRLRRDASVERRALHELGVYYVVSLGPRPGRPGRARGARGDRPCARSPTPRAPSAAAPA